MLPAAFSARRASSEIISTDRFCPKGSQRTVAGYPSLARGPGEPGQGAPELSSAHLLDEVEPLGLFLLRREALLDLLTLHAAPAHALDKGTDLWQPPAHVVLLVRQAQQEPLVAREVRVL